MATMMEETQFSSYSAGHLSASYDSPSQSNYAVAPLPYRACSGLSSVPIYESNLTFNTFYDPNQPLIDIHPDEMIGSNTEAPPEVAYVAQLTPQHILTQVQQGRFRPSFSAPSTPESPSFKYLPPGAFHTKPLMRRSSNIPISHSSVPVLKTDYEEGMQMMVDQPSYVAVDGNGEYLQDISSHYEQPLQQTVNYENTETFLQPHSQSFTKPDAFSPAPTSISVDYSRSPSLPITPPPSGTFPQHSYYIHQQQMMSQYVSVAMHHTGPVPLSSPSISEDGCCNPRSLFVNPSAIATESFNTPRSVASSPEQEQQSEVAEHLSQPMKVESPDAEHGMEDVTSSAPLERALSPKNTIIVKVPAHRKPAKRLVATPPRRRQSSAMSRKASTVSAPALERRPSVLDDQLVQSVPIRGRVPKRLKDALVALAPGSATPERAQSVAMSREQTLMPTHLEPSAIIESRPHSRLNYTTQESPLSSPKTPAFRNRSTKKRKARHSSAPILAIETTKLFICDVLGCEKRFRRSEHLKRHARSLHTLEKPYVCNQPDCNKKFSRSDNLNQHLRVHKRNAEEAAGIPYIEPSEEITKEEQEEQKETAPSTPAPSTPTPAPPTPEQAPPSPVKVGPKRRRGGPKSVGAAAPKRRNRQAPPPATRGNADGDNEGNPQS